MKDINSYDYIEKLELAEKILGNFVLLFWFASIFSVEPGVIWFIGILLPALYISSKKPKTLLILLLCTILYIITATVITHKFFCFLPHLACCICCVVESLLIDSLKKVEQCDYNLREKTREMDFMRHIKNEHAQQNKNYKEKVDDIYMLLNDGKEIDEQKIDIIKEKIEYLWVMYG